jgi:hypothetical protein
MFQLSFASSQISIQLISLCFKKSLDFLNRFTRFAIYDSEWRVKIFISFTIDVG